MTRKPRRLLFQADYGTVSCDVDGFYDDKINVGCGTIYCDEFDDADLNLKQAKKLNAWLTRAILYLEGKDD